MIFNMVMELKLGKIKANTRESFSLGKSVVLAGKYGLMGLFSLVFGKTITSTVL